MDDITIKGAKYHAGRDEITVHDMGGKQIALWFHEAHSRQKVFALLGRKDTRRLRDALTEALGDQVAG